MTKILSQLLAAQEPDFRLGVTKLERASGDKSHDIRLTGDVLAATRAKLAELDLDASDTTGPELYQALSQKLIESDKELAKVLKLEPLEANFLDDFTADIKRLTHGPNCFVLKASVAKKLLKSNPPKKAMRALGYRSLDSMLKHESLAGLYASTSICETSAWHKNFEISYKKLTPSDFEERSLAITPLTSSRWQELAASYVEAHRNALFSFPEIGTLAILPLEDYQPGMLSAMFLLTLAAANSALATSSYLRLNQVKSDFGKRVANAAKEELSVASPIGNEKLNWQTVHEFLTNSGDGFEPQFAGESQSLISPADTLASLSPALAFWRGTSHLAHLANNEAVSLNPLDASLNYINRLPFEQRITHHFRQNLWHQFWQRYLQAEALSEKLLAGLRLELTGPALEPELIDSGPVSSEDVLVA